jgi:hypothetical protein
MFWYRVSGTGYSVLNTVRRQYPVPNTPYHSTQNLHSPRLSASAANQTQRLFHPIRPQTAFSFICSRKVPAIAAFLGS